MHTPLTDEAIRVVDQQLRSGQIPESSWGIPKTFIDHARQLEERVRIAENKLVEGVHTCHSECQRPQCLMRREHETAMDVCREVARAGSSHVMGRAYDLAMQTLGYRRP